MDHAQLDALLREVAAHGWSDLHLKAGSPPRARVHGALEALALDALTPEDTAALAAAVMRGEMASRLADGHEVDFAYAVDRTTRFRVNAYHQRETVALVFRRIDTTPRTLEALDLPPVLARFADESRGLVLVAGPTGSGKTTTLAAMVHHINTTRKVHVVTIEDPIEILHDDIVASISQREMGIDTPDYVSAMRAALRQDPDVMLVGEMRDQETVLTAVAAAETGHLVLSTLHTHSAAETVNRILEYFPPEKQKQMRIALASSLKGIVCQRLVPRADGLGRVAATEVMASSGRVQQAIVEPRRADDLTAIIAGGEYYGMHTFDQSLARLYENGVVELQEALDTASNPHDLSVTLRQRGLIGVS